MAAVRGRDNPREKAVRRLLHAAGLRFRVHHPIPGRPRRTIDIAFTRVRIAVFIDGCFWHGCPRHATSPKANAEWWQAKIAQNRLRDLDTSEYLTARGWQVVRAWEHEPPEVVAATVLELVRAASVRP